MRILILKKGVAVLIADKVTSQQWRLLETKNNVTIMKKWSIFQEGIII